MPARPWRLTTQPIMKRPWPERWPEIVRKERSYGHRHQVPGLQRRDLAEAPWFVAGAFVWIFIHGLFCLAGAWLFRVDVHSVAIASAANIGAAASAPLVAAHHRPNLVPASILMALLGYAMGNYLAPLTGHLARMAAGIPLP